MKGRRREDFQALAKFHSLAAMDIHAKGLS